jgi:hypothetical protein
MGASSRRAPVSWDSFDLQNRAALRFTPPYLVGFETPSLIIFIAVQLPASTALPTRQSGRLVR